MSRATLTERGYKEALASLAEIRKVLEDLTRDAEQRLAAAQLTVASYRMLLGLTEIELGRHRTALTRLEQHARRQGASP